MNKYTRKYPVVTIITKTNLAHASFSFDIFTPSGQFMGNHTYRMGGELFSDILNKTVIPECALEMCNGIIAFLTGNKERMIYNEHDLKEWIEYRGKIENLIIAQQPQPPAEIKEPKAAAAAVFNEYEQFYDDLPILKKHGFITDTKNGYKWEKSKVSLSEYFGSMKNDTTHWKAIENLFKVSGLKNSFSSNGSAYGKKKPSKDYLEIQEILKDTPDS